MTGSNDKDTLDRFFREAFEQMPETPAPTGWDAPPSDMWSKIQTDLNTTPTPPAARFGRLWYVGAAGVVALLALFLYFSNTSAEPSAESAEVAKTAPLVIEKEVQEAAGIADTPAENIATELPTAQQVKKSPSVQSEIPKVVVEESKVARLDKVDISEKINQISLSTQSVITAQQKVLSLDNQLTINAFEQNDATKSASEAAPKKRFPNTLERLKAEAAAKEKAAQNPLWLDLLPVRPIPPVER